MCIFKASCLRKTQNVPAVPAFYVGGRCVWAARHAEFPGLLMLIDAQMRQRMRPGDFNEIPVG
jgi:hypothetical protein